MKVFLKIFLSFSISVLFFFNTVQAQTIMAPPGPPGDSNTIAYTKVEIDASFPGGNKAWTKYITNQIMQNADHFRKKDFGTCVIRFIVGTDGSIRDAEAITMQKTRLAQLAIDAIKNGPKWIPAQQNGKNVNAYRLQPVTLTEPEK